LVYLNGSDNKIGIVPHEIKNFVELITLNLSFNRIKEFPDFFSKLNKLQVLNLEGESHFFFLVFPEIKPIK